MSGETGQPERPLRRGPSPVEIAAADMEQLLSELAEIAERRHELLEKVFCLVRDMHHELRRER